MMVGLPSLGERVCVGGGGQGELVFVGHTSCIKQVHAVVS
jgi:hypothetical protein